jgi:Spy/CpxP family protein refolding chaperone
MVSKYFRVIVPAILTIGLVAGAAQLASSNTGMLHGHMRHRGAQSLGIPMRLLLRNANLTDAQKTQLHQIISSRLATRKAEWQQLHAAKEQLLAKYVSTGPVSASDLSGPLQQVTQIKDQMAQEQLQDAIAIRNLLTPAQLQQMSQTKSKMDQIRAEMKSLFSQNANTKATE